MSLPRLGACQVRAIGPAAPRAVASDAALAVIGPGTGLGVAGLVPTRHGWVAVPGEGGHATLARGDAFEAALIAAGRRDHPHVSAGRLLSGLGLPVLHGAVAAVLGATLPAAPSSAGEIVERSLADGDEVCSRSVDCFRALLGSFAGNWRHAGAGAAWPLGTRASSRGGAAYSQR